MKKISDKEFREIIFKRRKGLSSEFIKILAGLDIGEHLFIGKDEWKLKSDPHNMISSSIVHIKSSLVGYRFSTRLLADDSGWIITRREKLEDALEVETGYRCSICKEMFDSRKSARSHLAQTHPRDFGRVMYLKVGKREPSDRWKKYIKGKSLISRIFNPTLKE